MLIFLTNNILHKQFLIINTFFKETPTIAYIFKTTNSTSILKSNVYMNSF